MRLKYIRIKGYKSLKDISLNFRKQNFTTSINFFIGLNGAGKSTMLEAIGLIFTRIIQNELPGFYFELEYDITDKVIVSVKQNNSQRVNQHSKKLVIEIIEEGKKRICDRIPEEYLPDNIIAFCSGANGLLDDILLKSPKMALASDLYDVVNMSSEQDGKFEKVEEILSYYEHLDTHPKVLYLDATTSKYIIPVLCAILPLDFRSNDKRELCKKYFQLRQKLFDKICESFSPIAFSIIIDEEKLRQADGIPQCNILSRIINLGEYQESVIKCWSSSRQSYDDYPDEKSTTLERVKVFLFDCVEGMTEGSYYQDSLQEIVDRNPFILLSTLITTYHLGIIKDIQLIYQRQGCEELLGLDSLSDGELMWIARMGIVLLSQEYCCKNNLFLYDEPDVHFNDDWNKDFVNMIKHMCTSTFHEFLIATHSTLILTDALHEQLHLFQKKVHGETEIESVNISSFAAQREQISSQIFETNSIGTYAQSWIEKMMDIRDLEELEKKIGMVGPGYQRFRLYEHYYNLKEQDS